MKKIFCFAMGTLLLWPWASAQNFEQIAAILGYPQTIYTNAKIITVDDASFNDTLGSIAEAMAIRDKKILAIGSNEEIRALEGPETRVIDLGGRTVVPGFIMVHNHPMDWAPVVPQIMQTAVPEDVMINRHLRGPPRQQLDRLPQVIADAVKVAKPGVWIQVIMIWGIEVDPDDPHIGFAGTWFTKEQLEELAPNNPVMVRSREAIVRQGRQGMLNQMALDLLRKEAHPDFLKQMDLDHVQRTGVMRGNYHRTVIPQVIFKDHLDLYTEMMRLDVSWWTSIGQTTFGGFLYHYPNVIKAFRNLDRRGELDNRIAWGWGATPNAAWSRDFQDPFLVADLATRERTGTDYMWYFGTGETGGGCVSMEPLPSRKGRRLVVRGPGCKGQYERGGPVWNALYEVVKNGGRLMGSHQFGDVDIDNIMKLIREASLEGGLSPEEIRARRHSADHMQGWPRPNQVPLMQELGMIAGGSNLYIYQDSPRWLRDYGEKSLEQVVPRKSLANSGIMTGIEIDKPLELTDATAFTTLVWSMTRKARDGKVYLDDQRLSRQLALKTATIWGAYYVLREDLLGSLEPGKFADFLVLDRDYLSVPLEEIGETRILMTVVGDKIAHLVPSLATQLGMKPTGAQVELGGPAAQY